MHDAVTEHVAVPPEAVWALVAEIRNTGRLSPETFEAEWLDGATGPAVGVRFRGHVRRGGRGPVYWSVCRITACEPGREFGFDVLVGGRPINSWHYAFAPDDGGTAVTESFRLAATTANRIYWTLLGRWRGPYNRENMRTTLHRPRALAEETSS